MQDEIQKEHQSSRGMFVVESAFVAFVRKQGFPIKRNLLNFIALIRDVPKYYTKYEDTKIVRRR